MSAHSDLRTTSEDLSRALADVPDDQRTWVKRSVPCNAAHALLVLHALRTTAQTRRSNKNYCANSSSAQNASRTLP